LKRKSWQKNFLYSLITLVVNALVPLISYPYLTRTLGPENLGKFNFAYAIAHVFFFLVQLGLPYYGAREIAKVADDEAKLKTKKSELFGLSLISGFFFSAVYILLIIFIPRINQDKELFVNIGFIVFLAPFMLNWLFQGLEDFKYIASRNISFRVVGLILMFLIIKDTSDYTVYGLIMAFIILGHFLINIIYANKRPKFSFKNIDIKKHIKPSLLTLPATLVAIVLIQVGSIMLGFLGTNRDVAFFSIPAQIVMILTAIMTALSFVMVPRLTVLLKQGGDQHKKTASEVMSLSWLLVFPMCIGLIMISDELIFVFAGDAFSPAAASLKIGALRVVAIAISGFAGAQVLVANGEEKKLFTSLIAGITFMIAIDFMLIPALGHVGAMIGAVCAEFLMGGLQLYLGRKYFSLDMFLNFSMLKYILAALTFIPICLLIKSFEFSIIITLMSCVLACIITYIVVLIILKDKLIKKYLTKGFKRGKENL
jgi:O-antigen/teichoic acid export membrane protein